jgi:hypothetical protein
MATKDDVAQWMLQQVNEHGRLSQAKAAREIKAQFGEEFVYRNKNGNKAIQKEVLTAFRQLSAANVVWKSADRVWRERRNADKAGRKQR